jgi:deoxycytidylate deaminase
MIINAGIRTIVYLAGYADAMSEEMLNQAGVAVRRFVPDGPPVADEGGAR